MDKKEIIQKYSELLPLYERLADNLKLAIKDFLTNAGVAFFEIENRVKTIESILNKLERKNYQSPFDDINDICGLRIITYYISDLDKVSGILTKEFDVIEIIDKQEEMEEDRFGYRSYHFLGKLKDSWLHAPNYRGLGDLLFEIQFRTVLMHGWAAISHKLSYKHEKDIPKRFRRDLFRMSALIELADEQFERLRKEREEYTKGINLDQEPGREELDVSEDLNLDILRKVLELHFPERKEAEEDLSSLLEELNIYGITLESLTNRIKHVLPYLPEMEKDEIESKLEPDENLNDNDLPLWTRTGAVRTVLDLTSKDYHEKRSLPEHVEAITEKWQKIIDKYC